MIDTRRCLFTVLTVACCPDYENSVVDEGLMPLLQHLTLKSYAYSFVKGGEVQAPKPIGTIFNIALSYK